MATDPWQVANDKLSKLNTGINSGVQRLINSDDPKSQALGAQLAQQYGVQSGGGGAAPSLIDQVKNSGASIGNNLADTLHVLSRPAQGVLHGLQAFSGKGVEGLTNPDTYAQAATQFGQGLTGQAPDINFRQAANLDPNAHADWDKGGLVAGAADTILGGALDPTTYLTLGTGGAAQTGLKQLGKHLAENPESATILRDVMQKGAKKVLGPEEQAALRESILKSPEAANVADPERFADKTLKAIQEPQGLSLMGLDKTIVPYGKNLAPVAQTLGLLPKVTGAGEVGDAGVLRALADTKAGQAVGKITAPVTDALKGAFVTGNAIKDAAGQAGGSDVLHGVANTVEGANQAAGDAANVLNALGKQAKITDKEMKDVVVPAFETGTQHTLAAAFRAGGDEPRAAYIDALDSHLKPPAGPSPQQSLLPNDVLPAQLTKAGTQAVDKHGEQIAQSLGIGLGDLQKAVKGEQLPAGVRSLGDFEKSLQSVTPGKKDYLNHDLANLAVQQTHDQATRRLKDDFLTGLKTQTKGGEDLVVKNEATANAKGYVAHELADGSKVYMHPALAKTIKEVTSVINQDQTIKGFDSTLQHLGRLWKGYAVFSVGFHEQNVVGNFFMNTLAGMKNPKYYTEAKKWQSAIRTAGNSGKPFDEALREVKGLTPRDIRIITAARAEHTIDNGYFTAQQSVRAPKSTDKSVKGRATAAASKLNPFSTNNAYLHANRAIGGLLEQNSRLAHFGWKFDETGNGRQAAESVNKYLFDYNDLTPLEKKRLLAVAPFLTYMRKNIPAQFKFVAEHPGAYNNLNRAEQNALYAAPDDGTQYDPQKLANGAVPVNLPGIGTVLVDPRDPIHAAAQAAQPIGALASLIPGTKHHGEVINAQQKAAQGLLANIAGFSGSLAKYTAEEAAGHNLNNGAPVKPGEDGKRLVGALNPLLGRANSTYKAVQSGNDAGVLRNIAGLPISAGGGTATNATLAGRLAEVQAALKNASATAGADKVPTITQLRAKGKIAPKVRKARTKMPRKHKATTKSHKRKA